MKTYTSDELNTIRAKHIAWLNDQPDGERANLTDANLRDANLISAGISSRGYHFLLVNEHENVLRVKAGCRNFTIAEAKAHWANKPEELARVVLLETLAVARGWVKTEELQVEATA